MKAICERDALHRALRMVAGRAKKNTAGIEILSNVLLDVSDGEIVAAATDLSTRSEARCRAEVEIPGSTTVSADRLTRLVDLMPSGVQVSLSQQDNELHVRAGRSRYVLPTLGADMFPVMSQPTNPVSFGLGCLDVKRLLTDPVRAISTNSARPYLEGGFLHQDGDGLRVIGCDGNRLVGVKVAPLTCRFESNYIIPKAAMAEIVKLAVEGEVQFRIGTNLIEVHGHGCTFTSKLIEGTYPDLLRIIPESQPTFITVARDEFAIALKRLCGLAADYSTIDLSWAEAASHLEMNSSGVGSGSEQVGCECTAPASRISFAPSILSEMIDVFDGELLQLHIISPQKSMRLVDPEDPDLTVLAAPCAPRNASAAREEKDAA